ncbi:MAG TPA: FAD-dependent oxidoreductase [Polyangiaceae bacterium]|nr:FAD-dependent oxidoreductase [Polyangiaceae bacterium]
MSAPTELTLDVGLDEPADDASIRTRLSRALHVSEEAVPPYVLRKRSLDARRGSIRFHLLFELGVVETTDLGAPHPREVGPRRVVVVGGGPAGLFCAYELARRGIGSVVVDRGKQVQPRRRDLKGLTRHGVVDPDSNYCFGEGGAGTYSDGKLYTRAHKRGSVRDVIEILARHGAPESILVEARPHIGSNRLPDVVTHMREELEGVGVEFRHGARVVELLLSPGAARVRGVRFADGSELDAAAVVLATGHSASDVYELLLRAGVRLEPKSFALGVRIEHPQPLLNRIQFGRFAGHPKLPAAAYRVAETIDGRGVFSFCMCPGGFIVPAATVPTGLVVNGMSLSRRDSPFANSGLVVSVDPADYARAGFAGPLGGVALQRAVEAAALAAGGEMLRAPATRATDFVERRGSSTVPKSSYVPGVVASDVADVLAASRLPIADCIRGALVVFERRLRGYLTEEAILVGVETRTSSPVRIPRDEITLESPDAAGLYPAGEGAGYAGGIMSAAMDGVRIAQRIAARGV